ncbi:MAG: FecR domain-containing protein [Chloracidobacterium sp.]|nr:FecR domain-containing protein [Chloracidobacterium sp.]
MRVVSKLIGPFLFTLTFLTLSRIFVFGAPAAPAQFLNLPDEESSYSIDNDAEPDVTARVARISYIKGEAQIRRADGGDWEKVTLNLPVVEGDEITTSGDARLEIQFDNNQHLRLAENAYLKIVNLKDEGIALSLSLGTMSLRVTRFDKDKSTFEIDAPKTTIAVQKAGVYRIDAGQQNDAEIRVSVTQNGEARVYSDEAGFTLKNDRSARIFVDGPNAGEWEAADFARYTDEFDSWSLERDATIAERLKDAFYDKYYDNDIYGADDLNGYGDWVHTASYGYVWRPYRNSLSHYADWSPYRYGHWRWIPPFGWTWVNDEPWGWATYHHGRWFHDAGHWYWSPYGYYRHSRSWWRPALVFVTVYNNNVCWYPLGYHYSYYNYNYNYNCHGRRCNNGGHNSSGHHQPTYPTGPTGGVKPPKQTLPPKIPANAVIAMAMDDFGTTVKPVKSAPFEMANTILTKNAGEVASPVLPTYSAVTKKISREIATDRPKTDIVASQTKVGAAPRKTNAPLDKELRNTRVLGGRESVKTANDSGGVKSSNNGASDPRKTGAVTRQPPVRQSETTPPPIRQAPVSSPPTRTDTPVRQQPTRTDTPVRQPPVRQETPRSEPAPTRQTPRSEPSPTRQPPVKSEPKQDSKPSPSRATDSGSRKAKEG